jgi:predicted  nucleic acid-binding Zn-ribbon protein
LNNPDNPDKSSSATDDASEKELLDQLESRWEHMVSQMRQLQEENQRLKQECQAHEQTIAQLNEQSGGSHKQIETLQDQRKQTLERVDSLLQRFDQWNS